MSKITRSAISQQPVNQKTKKVHQIHIFIHLLADLGSQFKIPNATEAVSTFRHLENWHLKAQQMAQR